MALADERLVEFLACPEDKGSLMYFADRDILYNPRLHRSYEIREGIAVMLIDQATTLTDTEHDALMAHAQELGMDVEPS